MGIRSLNEKKDNNKLVTACIKAIGSNISVSFPALSFLNKLGFNMMPDIRTYAASKLIIDFQTH